MSDSLALANAKQIRDAAPVECLGMTFESDDARRQHFMERLRAELPELRKRPDFPKGEDEDILRMSDPPYYTACPNPFLAEFVKHYGKPYDPDDGYHREPFAVDVSVGKTDRLYRAHGYHTKVPHLAIVPSILHYTKPGDIVLDGFCGSGMTGVAAQWCGVAPAEYRKTLEAEWKKIGGGGGGGGGAARVGSPARCPWRPVARGHLHRGQLQHPVRRGRVRRSRQESVGRRGEGSRLDVRDSPHRRRDEGQDQLHGVERGVRLPGVRG